MTTRTLNRSLLATMIGAVLAVGTAVASPAHAANGNGRARHDTDEEAAAKAKAKQAQRDERGDHVQANANGRAAVRVDERGRVDADANARAAAQLRAGRNQAAARAQMEARIAAARAERDQARARSEREQQAREQARLRGLADRDHDRALSPRPSDRALDRSPTHREIAPQAGVPYGQIVSAERHRRNEERAADRDRNRVSEQQRRIAIARERARQDSYRDLLAQRQRLAYQRSLDLQRANRLAQYRYQQQYYERLRQMRLRDSGYNWYNDPYVNAMPTYGYYRTGNYYQVNNYAADLLRQAVRLGYQEGYQAGRADLSDGWRYDYRNAFAYQDANYGYRGYYVDRAEYNYYFRQGFQRGYEDGYRSQYRYGRYDDGNPSILETVLSVILNLRGL
jgi:hypothetical protein